MTRDPAFQPWRAFDDIPGLIDWAAESYGDAAFVIEEDGAALSFAELRVETQRAARALMASGIEPGDRVAIWAANGARWIIAALGAQTIGASVATINTRFRGGEAVYVLERTRAPVLFAMGGFLGADHVEMLQTAAGGRSGERPVAALSHLRDIVLVDDAARLDASGWDEFLARGDVISDEALATRRAGVGSDTIADILFTSGTTGRAKGAMHSHAQALWAVERFNFINCYQRGDRMLIINPFFHSFGYRAGWMACLMAGAAAYPHKVFDVERALKTIERERISLLPGPPTLFQSMLDHPERASFDLSSLRVGTSGSANFPEELARRAHEELGMELFLTSYGLTEATAMATTCRAGDDFETISRTVGRAFPDVEVAIAGAQGGAAPAGEASEVLVRGVNVMKGYLDDPDATADAIDTDGWLHTGDVGMLDDAGNLKLVDRMKDVVIVGGFNVYPAEVETILRQRPEIAEVAVVAAPDARMGEVCAAFVILTDGAELSFDVLNAWARENMANFKAPRHLFVVEEFPRTALGKIQKNQLRDRARELLAKA